MLPGSNWTARFAHEQQFLQRVMPQISQAHHWHPSHITRLIEALEHGLSSTINERSADSLLLMRRLTRLRDGIHLSPDPLLYNTLEMQVEQLRTQLKAAIHARAAMAHQRDTVAAELQGIYDERDKVQRALDRKAEAAQAAVNRAARRMRNRFTAEAFTAWSTWARTSHEQRVKAIGRIKNQLLYSSFNSWHGTAVRLRRERVLRTRALKRIVHGLLAQVFEDWVELVAAANEQRRLAAINGSRMRISEVCATRHHTCLNLPPTFGAFAKPCIV